MNERRDGTSGNRKESRGKDSFHQRILSGQNDNKSDLLNKQYDEYMKKLQEDSMIIVTGANGHLGRAVVENSARTRSRPTAWRECPGHGEGTRP